jgi:hypothetical protein
MKKEIQKKAVGAKDVASMYGVAEGTLANMRCRGEGPKYYRMGRKILYRLEDAEQFFFSNPVMTRDAHDLR